METMDFVTRKHGSKPRRCELRSAGKGKSVATFAIAAVKADKLVYFGMPGNTWIEVLSVSWDGKEDTLEEAIAQGIRTIEKNSSPIHWAYEFAGNMLNEILGMDKKPHRDYTLALLDDYETYQGKKWKPE